MGPFTEQGNWTCHPAPALPAYSVLPLLAREYGGTVGCGGELSSGAVPRRLTCVGRSPEWCKDRALIRDWWSTWGR